MSRFHVSDQQQQELAVLVSAHTSSRWEATPETGLSQILLIVLLYAVAGFIVVTGVVAIIMRGFHATGPLAAYATSAWIFTLLAMFLTYLVRVIVRVVVGFKEGRGNPARSWTDLSGESTTADRELGVGLANLSLHTVEFGEMVLHARRREVLWRLRVLKWASTTVFLLLNGGTLLSLGATALARFASQFTTNISNALLFTSAAFNVILIVAVYLRQPIVALNEQLDIFGLVIRTRRGISRLTTVSADDESTLEVVEKAANE